MRDADDPRKVYERYAQEHDAKTPFPVKAEELPAITMKASIERPYKDALFAANSVGPLKSPVKTSYGWHVIFLEEIIPAEHETVSEAEEGIRERLSQKKRLERVVSIIDKLQAQGVVEYNEPGVKQLLSMSGLPKRAE